MDGCQGNEILGNEELLVELDINEHAPPTYPLNLLVPDTQEQELLMSDKQDHLLEPFLQDGSGDCRTDGGGNTVPVGRLIDTPGGQSTEDGGAAGDDSDMLLKSEQNSSPDVDMEAIFEEANLLADQFAQLAKKDDVTPANDELLDAPMSLPGESDLLPLDSGSAASGSALTPAQAVINALLVSRVDPGSPVSPAQAVLSALVSSGVVPADAADDHHPQTRLSPVTAAEPVVTTAGISPFNGNASLTYSRAVGVSRIGAGGTFTRQKVLNGNFGSSAESAGGGTRELAYLDNHPALARKVEATDNISSQHIATSARNLEYSVTPVSNGPTHPQTVSHPTSPNASHHKNMLRDRNGNRETWPQLAPTAAQRLDPPDPRTEGLSKPTLSATVSQDQIAGQLAQVHDEPAENVMQPDLDIHTQKQLGLGGQGPAHSQDIAQGPAQSQGVAQDPGLVVAALEDPGPAHVPPPARNLLRKDTYVCRSTSGTYRVDKKKRFGTFKVDKSLVVAAAAEVGDSDLAAPEQVAASQQVPVQQGASSQQEPVQQDAASQQGPCVLGMSDDTEGTNERPEMNTFPFSSGADASPPESPPPQPAAAAVAAGWQAGRQPLTSTPFRSDGSSCSSVGMTPIHRQNSGGLGGSPVPAPAVNLRLRGPAVPPGVRPTTGHRQPGTAAPHPLRAIPQPGGRPRQPSGACLPQPVTGLRQPATGLRQPSAGLRKPSSGLREPSASLQQPSSGLRQPSARLGGSFAGLRQQSTGLRQPANSGLRQPANTSVTKQPTPRQPAAATGGARQPAGGARQLVGGARQLPGGARQRPVPVPRSGSDSSVCSGPNQSRSNPSLIEDRSDVELSGLRPQSSRLPKSQLPGPVSRIPGRGGVRRSAALTGSLTNISLQTTYGSAGAPANARNQETSKLSLSSAAPPSGGDLF